MLEVLLKDLRRAAAGLARTPAVTAIVVVTLGIGTGGTLLMFTAVNAAFFRPLPLPAADRLVTVWQTRPDNPQVRVSLPDARDWEAQSHSFAHLAAYGVSSRNVTSGADPERVTAAYVTPGFFATLGVSPLLGRALSTEEFVFGGPRSVVVGHRLWRRAFGGDPGVLGRTSTIDGGSFTVVGVMPRGFGFPEESELWLPLYAEEAGERSAHNFRVVARLAPGVDREPAQADMAAVAARLARAYPEDDAGYGIAVEPLRQTLLGNAGRILLVLMGAVGLVLLIACANVANLLLARSLRRRPETTLRLALGANRMALLRPFLLESLLLAVMGSALGLELALLGKRLTAGLAPAGVLDPEALRLDAAVLTFALLVTLAVALLCSVAPAIGASRQDLRTALAAGGRSLLGGGRRGMNVLISIEVAMAFVLLVGAGLLLRTAQRLEAVDPGFRARDVFLLAFNMGGSPGSRYDDPGWRGGFFSQLLARAATAPGAEAAGLISQPPLGGRSPNGTLLVADEGADAPGHLAHYRLVGGDYFAVLGIPVQRGRPFSRDDRGGTEPVALVNETLARSLGGRGGAIGRRVKMPGMDLVEEWATIVGVVGDVRHLDMAREPVPEVYFPYLQRPGRTWEMSLAVRAAAGAAAVRSHLREQVRALDPGLPIRFEPMTDLLDANLAPSRFRALLLGEFALTALVLAAVGLFGVVSYAIGQRSREIGVRMALGAEPRRVWGLVVREAMAPVLVGIGLGLLGALALTRLLGSIVFGVTVNDPLTFGVVVLVLAATAVAAAHYPARRAMRVDPLVALRLE